MTGGVANRIEQDGAAVDATAPVPLALGRLALVPDRSGALWLPDEGTLVVADLHLEKGSAFAMRGQFLPPYDSRSTLASLERVLAQYNPRRIIALGDTWHDRTGHARLCSEDAGTLATLIAGRTLLWIRGNHDPVPTGLPGESADRVEIGGVRLLHEPGTDDGPEIAGHLHPVAKVRLRGRSVRRRCFAVSRERIVLPAMGAFAGGLNVRDAAFRALFPRELTAHMLGDTRLFAVGRGMLLPD